MIFRSLEIPRWLSDGIKQNHKGARMAKIIYGADTETLNGKPMTLQFYSEDVKCNQLFWVGESNAARTFLRWCGTLARNCTHVIYIHNLAFDLPEFFWGYHPKLIGVAGDYSFDVGKWKVTGVYGSPTFCRMSDGHGTSILLVDSFSFYRGSLASAAELFCPNLPKLRHPKGLGEKQFRKSDDSFIEYAMRDAVVAYHIGKNIERLHHEFDLVQCVSVADLAARIFRHHFLDYTIPQPERECIEMALHSYHGGKNNITVPAGWYEGVTSLDISSAYPHAMRSLPAFSLSRAYRKFSSKRVSQVPEYGVYRVRATVKQCQWPVMFSHSFKPLHGAVDGVCVCGSELNEGIASGEVQVHSANGYFYDVEKDQRKPAFAAFVDDFYKRKESEKDPVKRYMYKTILNSVYGKFIQTRKSGKVDYVEISGSARPVVTSADELIAGGMFHPFIASAITAHTRVAIHRIEHRYRALHTATDGIFTQQHVRPSRASGLGSLKREAHGTLLLLRCKLYVLYSENGKIASRFPGKRIAKYALHGFQGTIGDLEKLVGSGRRKYSASRPNRLRESLKRGLSVNKFERRDYVLKIGALPIVQASRAGRSRSK